MIVIKGRVPAKKNSRNCFVRRGRMFNIPSKDYAAWHRVASLQLRAAHVDAVGTCGQVQIKFYFPDLRGCDLTNKAESIMDLLVDNGILTDDSWKHTGMVTLIPCGVDRENPRAEILLFK